MPPVCTVLSIFGLLPLIVLAGILDLVFAKKASPCEVKLKRIAIQPTKCVYRYLEKAAHDVPKYDWFSGSILDVTKRFYSNHRVGIEVFDAMYNGQVVITYPEGQIIPPSTDGFYLAVLSYDIFRTSALNLQSSFYYESIHRYYVTQLVRNQYGELYIIALYVTDDVIPDCGAD